MSVQDQGWPWRSSPGSAELVTELHDEIARFLSGKSLDRSRMAQAVRELKRQAPEYLEGLRRNLLADTAGAEGAAHDCFDVRAMLPTYQALGERGPARMPEIHAHLQQCSQCQVYAKVLHELEQDRGEWIGLSRQIREGERSAYLVLGERVWQWVADALAKPVALSRDDEAIGRRVGAWSLRAQPAAAVGRLAESHRPVALTASLPGNIGLVNLQVTPGFQAAAHATFWSLHLELDTRSRLSSLYVGVGDADRLSTGSRELRADRPVEFRVDPPAGKFYWLYFEWKTAQGEWKTAKLELPLRSRAPEGYR